jgi:hypothetical protein
MRPTPNINGTAEDAGFRSRTVWAGPLAGDDQQAGRGARWGARCLGRHSRDGEIHALLGELYERMYRYDEAANALRSYINLMPARTSRNAAQWARSQVQFLESFNGCDAGADQRPKTRASCTRCRSASSRTKSRARTRVNGNSAQDFVLDTGSEENHDLDVTARRLRVKPVTDTISAGVGEIGVRGLQLARLESLELGTLKVRNVPVLVKSPGLRGMPKPEGESFSPLSIGLSMTIDYEKQQLTMGHHCLRPADYRLPMRVHRLAPGARAAQREPSHLLRRRYRRGSDLHQRGNGRDAGAVAVPEDSAARLGHLGMGPGRVPAAGRQPRLRSHRVPQFPDGRPQSAGAQPAARIRARRDRRPQVPVVVPGVDGSAQSELRLQKF